MTRPTKRKQQLRASAKELNFLKSPRELRKRPKVVRKRAKKRIPAVATRVVKKRLPPNKATTEGGDLSYICANFGSHPSMSQPCIWCPHYFDKSRLGDHDTIPFEPVLPPKSKNIIRRKTTIWDIDLGKVIFIWRWFN